MRILFVLHRMHPNLREVEIALTAEGHHCTFAVASIGPSEPRIWLPRILVAPSSSSKDFVRHFFAEQKPDLLIQRKFEGGYANFWKVAREQKIPRLLYTQDPHQIPLFDAFFRPLRVIRLIWDLGNQRVLLGPHTRVTPVKFWGREGGVAFSHSEYLPFPARLKNSAQPRVTDQLTVLTVAKHGQKRKRVAWLLKALKQASAPFTLIIVGASPSPRDRRKQRHHRRLLNAIRNLGERALHVVLYEDLDRESMDALYSESDIFALPSKRELMAISPLEAMSFGLPVVASSDGGAACYISPVDSQQLFHARSYRDFKKKLFRLLMDENLRKRISERGHAYLENTHSPKVFVDRLATLATAQANR